MSSIRYRERSRKSLLETLWAVTLWSKFIKTDDRNARLSAAACFFEEARRSEKLNGSCCSNEVSNLSISA